MTEEQKRALALEIGGLTEKLNNALYRAWNAELSVRIDLITQKFHAFAGLELLDISVFLPLELGAPADTGSIVERAMTPPLRVAAAS